MSEEQELALEADTEVVAEDQTEVEDQSEDTEAPEAAEASEDEKSESQKRRERKKAAQERARAEMERLRKSEAEAKAKLERIKAAAQGEKKPRREDFDDPDDYVAASAAYSVATRADSREQKAAEAEAKALEAQREAVSKQMWNEQVAEAKSRYQDFEKVAYSAPISDDVANIVAASDMGADVAYHLGSNPDEARRISAMHPIDAAREIGRIEAALNAPQSRMETKAPPPITPVRGRATPTKDPAKMSYAEYRRWRMGGD